MYQPNYHPKPKAAITDESLFAEKHQQAEIRARLIECLKKSLPKINCDRLKLNQAAGAIISNVKISI